MLRGEVPQLAVPVLYGADECASRKKEGGIRPITVGNTFKRLLIKVGSMEVNGSSGVRVVEACDLSLLGAPVDMQGIPGTIHEKREAHERMTSKLEVLNPHQAFVLLKNAFAIPKLQYVLRASPAYLCGEGCF